MDGKEMEKAGKYNSCQTVVCRLVRGVGEKQAKVEREKERGREVGRERKGERGAMEAKK